jgi:histidine phosphotransferase ChpT
MGRIMAGLLKGGKVELFWQAHAANWPKDWAKLLMNAVLAAADCLPRGGRVTVETSEGAKPGFRVTATGTTIKLSPETEQVLQGQPAGALDGRSIQPYLTYQLSKNLNTALIVTPAPNEVRFAAG